MSKQFHVAIYLGDSCFAHVPATGKQVSVASMDNPYCREHFVRAGSFWLPTKTESNSVFLSASARFGCWLLGIRLRLVAGQRFQILRRDEVAVGLAAQHVGHDIETPVIPIDL